MKYETFGVPIMCFVGSKSKLHTIKTEDNLVSTKAKGAGKNVVVDELKFEDYKTVLLNRSNETWNKSNSKQTSWYSYLKNW